MKHLIATILTFSTLYLFSQLNMSQLGQLNIVNSHGSEASDIWGYVDQSGNEYAIVGLNDGVSIVDVTDPANPTEIFYHPDKNSIWRDIKTWGDYAYVTTEAQNSDGLLIIDLSTLPGNTNLSTTYYTGPANNQWESAHNLYIDDSGFCYIFGANRGTGGTIILDLSNPLSPTEVGTEDSYYTHDGVVRGNLLYQARIEDGFFTIHDISNKSNPVYLGQQTTPGVFAHNIWYSDDGNYAYTTDEISNGFLGEYDISDPQNIVELDRTQSSPGMNVIPHNTHFLNDYIITSYYRDGVVIHDVSNKGNMVEVANYDTSPSNSGDGFNGCWGVYPWLPSGNIIASDIENGLHVLGITYQRGCYLEGTVTEIGSNNPINNVNIAFLGQVPLDKTDAIGTYETGIAMSGTYDMVFSHPSYIDDTIYNVTLSNGQITTQDVQLAAIVPADVTINVTDDLSVNLNNAIVRLNNSDFDFNGTTNNGTINFTNVIPGTYNLTIGKWGYITFCGTINITGASFAHTTELSFGYYDDFNLDFGWTVSGNAPAGIWERADPNGTTSGGDLINPEDDVTGDCGNEAFVTGNSSTGGVGADDVDLSNTRLTSPVMDLSSLNSPIIKYNYWWVNTGGSGTPNDSLKVYLTDGNTWEVVEIYTFQSSSSIWKTGQLVPGDYFSDLSSIKISFETADWQADGGHLVEAAIDLISIESLSGMFDDHFESLNIYPNPSTTGFKIASNNQIGSYDIYDITGKHILSGQINNHEIIHLEKAGVYILVAEINGKLTTTKLIKQ